MSHSWNTYLTLEPHNPSATLAQRMLSVYGEEGLNQPAAEVAALQIVIPTKPPSAALYAELAEYSYKAHDVSQGDLASEKAVSLAPAAERKRVKAELGSDQAEPQRERELRQLGGAERHLHDDGRRQEDGPQIHRATAP